MIKLVETHPRDHCQLCGKKMAGGDDAVWMLESSIMSFHIGAHLNCYQLAVLKDMLSFPEGIDEAATVVCNMVPAGFEPHAMRDAVRHYVRCYADLRGLGRENL